VGTIYGMNFDHMPELSWRWGYPFALGLMVFSGVIIWAVFRRARWL
jgi:magnesium transporter